jgi:hypothetical protein
MVASTESRKRPILTGFLLMRSRNSRAVAFHFRKLISENKIVRRRHAEPRFALDARAA